MHGDHGYARNRRFLARIIHTAAVGHHRRAARTLSRSRSRPIRTFKREKEKEKDKDKENENEEIVARVYDQDRYQHTVAEAAKAFGEFLCALCDLL